MNKMAAENSDSKQLKLVVFGGSGLTGKEIVNQALEGGHHVTAVVRDPAKIEKKHPNLELFKGDACDVESFASVLVGKDAVMSCLGVVASIFNPTTFYSESLHALLEGMKRCEVKRLVTMTAWCTQPGPNNKWLVDWIINPLLLNGMIKDMATMEEMLERTDPEMLDYTIVRPCGLVNGRCLLLLLRIRFAHLQILGFPIGDAY
ncbi:flavin reductase (NADPH)-like isoform X2 [Montipora foliosa]|uniref:flavin reductase (NADPH)-like isoform X2 n=1 Tax=Montipora foliosa TaxID=591990 RepID=UPI0035F13185